MAYSNRNVNYQTRQNPQCCDNWEHMMSNGQWMCGKTHGACAGTSRMSTYSQGGSSYPANPPRRQGYIADHLGNGYEDDVPALLTAGEYVIRRDSTQKYGERFLDRLNRGLVDPSRVAHLNKGGKVKKSNRRSTVRNNQRRVSNRRPSKRTSTPARFNRGGGVRRTPQRFNRGGYVNNGGGGGLTPRKINYAQGGANSVWLKDGTTTGAYMVEYHCPYVGGAITKGCEKVAKQNSYALPPSYSFFGNGK